MPSYCVLLKTTDDNTLTVLYAQELPQHQPSEVGIMTGYFTVVCQGATLEDAIRTAQLDVLAFSRFWGLTPSSGKTCAEDWL